MARKGGKKLSKRLSPARCLGALLAMLAVVPGAVCLDARAGDASQDQGDTLVVHLVHPEGQAAALLKLFDGARMRHPAAALAAWKAAARPPRDLGKPLEAFIAFFNPEMTDEWRVMHGARLAVSWDAAHGRPSWHALVPRDDGTIAAAVAAMRLSEGAAEPVVDLAGSPIAVERLGRPGAALAARAGDTLIFGSSREELVRATRNLAGAKGGSPQAPGSGKPLLSGASVVLDGSRLASEPGQPMPVPARAAAELLRGLSCRRVEGSLALEGDALGLDFSMLLQPDAGGDSALWKGSAPIDPAWLQCVPAAGAMAVIALAFQPTREFWDSVFALADRLEKLDPARAETAPLRARLNLVARTAGVRLEADLWPHLRGLSAGVFGEAGRPGRATGILVALHLDSEAAAEHLLSQSGPGLTKLVGRELTAWRAGRDVLVAWGPGVASAARDASADPKRSVAPLCTSWPRTGKPAPHRLVAFWPARCWPLEQGPIAQTAAWSALTEDPPALWLGWNEQTKAFDTIRWAGLNRRVERFLEQLPLAQVSAR
jgi:hypothetical protein